MSTGGSFRLLRSYVTFDARSARASLRALGRDVDLAEARFRRLQASAFIGGRIVHPFAFTQLNALIGRLQIANQQARGIRIGPLGGGGGGGGGFGGGGRPDRGAFGLGFGRTLTRALGVGAAFRGVFFAEEQVGDVVKLTAEMEQNLKVLERLTGSAARAVAEVDKLRGIALDTTTNLFDDLIPLAPGLLTNLPAGTNSEELLRSLADISVITERSGVSFSELTRKVIRNASQFTLLTRDIREFTNAGVNLRPALANALGTDAFDGLNDAIANGEVNINHLIDALNELAAEGGQAFGLQAQVLGTLGGQADKLVENIDTLKVAIGERLLPVLTGAVVRLNELFEERQVPRFSQGEGGGATRNRPFADFSDRLIGDIKGFMLGAAAASARVFGQTAFSKQLEKAGTDAILFGASGRPDLVGLPTEVLRRQQRARAAAQQLGPLGPVPGGVSAVTSGTIGAASKLAEAAESLKEARGEEGFITKIGDTLEKSLSKRDRSFLKAQELQADILRTIPAALTNLATEGIILSVKVQSL